MAKQSLDEMIKASEDAIEKGQDLSEIEADHHGKEKPPKKSSKAKLDEKIKEKKFDQPAAPTSKVEISTAGIKEKKGEAPKPKAEKPKKGKAKIRSKKYQAVKVLIDVKEKYDLDEALALVKKTSMTKFDGNVEVHIRLTGKMGKPEQVRGLLQYPHSTGRSIAVIILDEKLIDEIAESKKIAADIYLATPALMPKVGKLAKILGPKGKMPNPKAGTITVDPEKTKKNLEGGQVEYKTDAGGNIHQVIGKVSGKTEELSANFKELLSALPSDKIASLYLCATMGPAVKIKAK